MKMKKTKLQIQFDGSRFFGWQIQKDSSPTVQEEINKVLEKIYKTPVKTIGSGRTDAKVHALKFFVVFMAPFEIDNEAVVKALNSQLPLDIRVLNCELVANEFRPTNDAKNREYRYLFTNNKILSPFQVKYMTNISYDLNFELMENACKEFVGTFDFASYQTTGTELKTSVRTIFECSLEKMPLDFHGIYPEHYFIKVVGSGFLKQMVRLMVGAIWDVGRGKLEPGDIQNSLKHNIGNHIAAVAPPQGLYKYNIEY